MNPVSGKDTYKLLIRNQWKTSLRSLRERQGWFMWLILGVMAVYSSFTLLVLGYYFDRFATEIFPSMDPVETASD